jgi:hypothetical protein
MEAEYRAGRATTIHEMIVVLEAFLSPVAVLAPALTKAPSGRAYEGHDDGETS